MVLECCQQALLPAWTARLQQSADLLIDYYVAVEV
jgi:hypothetical protein